MKKNKNKAFTLIEIVVILTILSVVLIITVPAVSNTISNAHVRTYEIDLESMKDAAKGYILKNNVEIPRGIQTRIELSDMVSVGIIDNIINTKSKEVCDGYVTVTLTDDEYSFHPYLDCGADYKSEDYDKTDYVLPTITLLGDNPVTINVGETYIEPGFVASDDVDGNITDKVLTTGPINPNNPASYEITYSVTDSANNLFEIKRTVTVVDTVGPIITYEPNGNVTYAKSGSTVVRVRDNAVLNNSSLKYHWVKDAAIPTESCFITTLTNNSTINTPASATGNYYLWVLAKDSVNNTTMTSSNIFYLDNTKPIITLNGSASVTITVGNIYVDAGATASDNIDGDITSSITTTSNININSVGSYTVTYNVSDKLGNVATSVTRTVNVTN
jgi:competence protein ComGC